LIHFETADRISGNRSTMKMRQPLRLSLGVLFLDTGWLSSGALDVASGILPFTLTFQLRLAARQAKSSAMMNVGQEGTQRTEQFAEAPAPSVAVVERWLKGSQPARMPMARGWVSAVSQRLKRIPPGALGRLLASSSIKR
jgi:hypothetical protein